MLNRLFIVCFCGIRLLAAQTTVTVSTAEEFVKAIGSNKTIYLNAGDYDLTDLKAITTNVVSWEDEYDGSQMVITNVTNLKIIGKATSRVLVSPQYTWVLKFDSCKNIQLDNFTMGHTQGGYCTGGVINLNGCENVTVTNCKLFGSGTYGMWITGSKNVLLEKSDVYKCTYGLLYISSSSNINFVKTRFRETGEFDLISIENSNNVHFKTCVFEKNNSSSNYFFKVDADVYYEYESNNQKGGSKNITINTCTFRDNKVYYFSSDYLGKLTLGDNRFERNDFGIISPTAKRGVPTEIITDY